ncbi:hypothetical protein NON08_11345 [Cetobacterium somerae]|uniref:hypothetical protein n=1 Tax=Cetobacterium sp. NK01 TaxID=2993530 RepID=UPI0021171822|nr:hypothetical protein [Cetobacterium sp. NK01]MCQ8213098.1 hypothetical protein [Cetobacterium sp. NK01]
MKRNTLVALGLIALSVLSFSQDGMGRNSKKNRVDSSKENLVGVDTYSFHEEERLKNSGSTGFVEIGMDTMIFERSVDEKNRVEPYLGFEFFPFENSNFYIDGKTSYRHEYSSSEKRYDKTMVELYGGSVYRNGKFFINYKFGVRQDELKHTKVQHSTALRFIPKATYDFTDKFGWYLKGAVGYAKVKGDERDQITKEFNLPFQNEDYVNKIETGLSYRINKTKLSLGVVNKSKDEYAGENIRWSYLAKVDHNLYATNTLQVRPYIWGFLNPEVETGGNRNKTTFHNELGAMVGTRAIWNPTHDFSITADVVYLAQYKNVSNDGQSSGGNVNSKSGGKPGTGGGNSNGSGSGGSGSGNGSGSGTGPGSGTGGGSKSIKRSVEESVIIRLGFKKYF